MYCTQCGAKIEDDSLFCSSCGGRVAKSDCIRDKAVTNSSSPANITIGREPSAESPTSLKNAVENTQKRSRRRMPLIALIALALTLASAIAFAAHYVYTQYIAPQQDTAGGQSTIAASEEGNEAEATNDQVRYQLYYDKCQEYLEQYGEPRFETNYNSSYAAGFVFAKLMDLDGDGEDELVLGRRTPGEYSNDSWGGDIASTTVDVWRFDSESNSLECAFSERPTTFTNGGFTYLSFVETSGLTFLEEQRFDADVQPVGKITTTFKTLSSGSPEDDRSLEIRYDQSNVKESGQVTPHYYLDGQECDVSSTSYCLGPLEAFDESGSTSSSYHYSTRPQDTIGSVTDTMSQLQHLAEQ